MDKAKIVVIGAGVIGLAIAAELSKKHKDVVVVEAESSFGQHSSSRNSEVIHAGIYYPPGSLKARLCVKGNQLLYQFCEKHPVPFNKLGKLIVAMNQDEVRQLHELEQNAKNNGVEGLIFVNAKNAAELEPAISPHTALFSPSTGIIDSHILMKVLEHQAEERGAIVSYSSKVTGIHKTNNGYVLKINNEYDFEAEIVVNSAGLFSDLIAQMLGIDINANMYKLHFCKGEYFSYSKPSFLTRLVYPVPEQDIKGLGIHAVIDMAGSLKFGPSAEYVDAIDYKVDPGHREKFYQAIKDLYPQVKLEDLSPDQSGIRPKLQGPGQAFRDFVISQDSPGFINLIGIESPGLTACLAIAEYVRKMVE